MLCYQFTLPVLEDDFRAGFALSVSSGWSFATLAEKGFNVTILDLLNIIVSITIPHTDSPSELNMLTNDNLKGLLKTHGISNITANVKGLDDLANGKLDAQIDATEFLKQVTSQLPIPVHDMSIKDLLEMAVPSLLDTQLSRLATQMKQVRASGYLDGISAGSLLKPIEATVAIMDLFATRDVRYVFKSIFIDYMTLYTTIIYTVLYIMYSYYVIAPYSFFYSFHSLLIDSLCFP